LSLNEAKGASAKVPTTALNRLLRKLRSVVEDRYCAADRPSIAV
jgi:hypothetical protein